ncbi:Homeobox-like_domain superfamily [Hexamita inflata]|uniref:Homeobox-like domain superfamily n=1 Tax=Hexamita inflata TaxID=28002 RepID=A0AA86S6D1_9EUKA|nr:Homeobox-like domain superfamily [Hexamita inflata]
MQNSRKMFYKQNANQSGDRIQENGHQKLNQIKSHNNKQQKVLFWLQTAKTTNLFEIPHSPKSIMAQVSRRLTAEERKVLEYIWEVGPQNRRTKDYMARYMKVSIQTVNHFVKRLRETGSCQVQRAAYNAKKYGHAEVLALAEVVRTHRFQTREFVAREFKKATGKKISMSSLTRLLQKHADGYNMYTDFQFSW